MTPTTMRARLLVALLAVIGSTSDALAVIITLDRSEIRTGVFPTLIDPEIYVPEFPDSGALTRVFGDISSATTGYDLSNGGFRITFDQFCGTSNLAWPSGTANIWFSPDRNVDYALAGTYSAIDAEGRSVHLGADLFDHTGSTMLFSTYQTSEVTPNESFTLGLQEGDYENFLLGSLTGTLLAGHVYEFGAHASIKTEPRPMEASATARGSVTLTFAPEPSSAALVALGLALLSAGYRHPR